MFRLSLACSSAWSRWNLWRTRRSWTRSCIWWVPRPGSVCWLSGRVRRFCNNKNLSSASVGEQNFSLFFAVLSSSSSSSTELTRFRFSRCSAVVIARLDRDAPKSLTAVHQTTRSIEHGSNIKSTSEVIEWRRRRRDEEKRENEKSQCGRMRNFRAEPRDGDGDELEMRAGKLGWKTLKNEIYLRRWFKGWGWQVREMERESEWANFQGAAVRLCNSRFGALFTI